MAIRNFAKYLTAAVLAVSCQVQELQNPQAPETTEPAASNLDAAALPGIVSVQFEESTAALIEAELAGESGIPTKALGATSLIEELGIVRLERVFPDAGEYEARSRKAGMHRFYRVIFSADTPVTKASESIASIPGVISAHPVRKYYKRGYATPNDTYFNRQWHYVNTKKAGVDINVKSVWENYTTGSEDVIVSVVDESVDPSHPDLQENLWKDAQGHTGYNFAYNNWDLSIRLANGNGDIGHGTHVAGTIGAVSNNGKGVAGIAGGDAAQGTNGVRLMSCAVFSGTRIASDFAAAVKWSADHGAVISQNSWGPSADLDDDGNIEGWELTQFRKYTLEEYDPEFKAAVDYFIENAGCDKNGNQRPDSPMKGGLVFFAAGNEGAFQVDWDPYAAYEPVIAVGAFNENGSRASYSNYGSWVDIAAPAGEGSSSSNSVWSTLPTKVADGIGGTQSTGGYGGSGWVGTSMATPHASGVAALIVSYFGGEGFTADVAKDILLGGLGATIGGTKPIGKKLDALSSFEYGIEKYGKPGGDPGDDPGDGPGDNPHPGENASPVISLSHTSLELNYNQGAVEVKVTVSDPDGDKLTVTCEPGSKAVSYNPSTGTATVDGFRDLPGNYTATFTVKDAYGGSAEASLNYVIRDNRAPFIDLNPYNITLKAHESAVISVTGFDPDGDEIEFTLQSPGSDAVTFDQSSRTLRIAAYKAPAGTYTAVMKVTDLPMFSTVVEKSATAEVEYTILPNHAPTVVKHVTDISQYGLGGITVNNSEYFSDPDGEILHYSVSVGDASVATAVISGENTVIAPQSYGVTTVTVTAEDGVEAKVSTSFKVAFANPQQPVTAESSQVNNELNLHIGALAPETVEVTVYNAAGARVLRQEFTASVLSPISLDVSSLAPGRYTAMVKYGGRSFTVKFVKY